MGFDATRNELKIPDLSSPTVLEGFYSNLKLTLHDTQDSQTFVMTVHVLPPANSTEGSADGGATDTGVDGKTDGPQTGDSSSSQGDSGYRVGNYSAAEKLVPLTYKIKEITVAGSATLEFSNEMDFPENLLTLVIN